MSGATEYEMQNYIIDRIKQTSTYDKELTELIANNIINFVEANTKYGYLEKIYEYLVNTPEVCIDDIIDMKYELIAQKQDIIRENRDKYKEYILTRLNHMFADNAEMRESIVSSVLESMDKYKSYNYIECMYDYLTKNTSVSIEDINEVQYLLAKVLDEKIQHDVYKKQQLKNIKLTKNDEKCIGQIVEILKERGLDRVSFIPIMYSIVRGNICDSMLSWLKNNPNAMEQDIILYLTMKVHLAAISD